MQLASEGALRYRGDGVPFGPDLLQRAVHYAEGGIGWSYHDEGYEWDLDPAYVAAACSLLLAHGSTVQAFDTLLRQLDFKGAATIGAIVGGLNGDARSIEVYCLDQSRRLAQGEFN